MRTLIELSDQIFKARQTQGLLDLLLGNDSTGRWVADGVAKGAGRQVRPGRRRMPGQPARCAEAGSQ